MWHLFFFSSLSASTQLTDGEAARLVSAVNARLLLDAEAPFVRYRIREPIENRQVRVSSSGLTKLQCAFISHYI